MAIFGGEVDERDTLYSSIDDGVVAVIVAVVVAAAAGTIVTDPAVCRPVGRC